MRGHQPGLWIPNSRKGEVGKRLEDIKRVEDSKGRCLFVIDEKGRACGKPVYNNCHVIPKSSVLEQLKEDSSGKVFELRWGVNKLEHYFISSNEANPIDLNAPDTFEPQLVGTGDACVRWFACKPHDDEFGLTDAREPDFSDPTTRFLGAYRAALYAADLSRLGTSLFRRWDKEILRSQYKQLRVQWIENRETLTMGIPRAKSIATRLGKIWYAYKTRGEFDPDIVSGQLLSFRSRLKFAACLFYGKGIAAIVFPVGEDRHKMGVLHLAEDSDSVKEDKERLTQMSDVSEHSSNYGVDVVEGLMTNGSGIVAASPESYRGLPDGERRTVKRLVARNSAVDRMVNSFPSQRPQHKGRRGIR